MLKTIELLDNSSKEPEDKARVLNALAYYIRDQIAATYKYTSPDNSDFYKSLTISLDLNKDNNPNREDLADMYSALEKFLRSHVYKNSDPRKGYLDKQPFAIKHYSVVDDILELSDRVHKLRHEIIIAARDLHLLQQKPKSSQGGLFSVPSGKEKVTDTHEVANHRL